jgi:hypothetical protein
MFGSIYHNHYVSFNQSARLSYTIVTSFFMDSKFTIIIVIHECESVIIIYYYCVACLAFSLSYAIDHPPRSPLNSTVSPTRITIIIASQPVPEIWNLPLSSSLTLRYRIVLYRSIGSCMLDNVQYLGASPSHLCYAPLVSASSWASLRRHVVTSSRVILSGVYPTRQLSNVGHSPSPFSSLDTSVSFMHTSTINFQLNGLVSLLFKKSLIDHQVTSDKNQEKYLQSLCLVQFTTITIFPSISKTFLHHRPSSWIRNLPSSSWYMNVRASS